METKLKRVRASIEHGQRILTAANKFLAPQNLELLSHLDVPRVSKRAKRILRRFAEVGD